MAYIIDTDGNVIDLDSANGLLVFRIGTGGTGSAKGKGNTEPISEGDDQLVHGRNSQLIGFFSRECLAIGRDHYSSASRVLLVGRECIADSGEAFEGFGGESILVGFRNKSYGGTRRFGMGRNNDFTGPGGNLFALGSGCDVDGEFHNMLIGDQGKIGRFQGPDGKGRHTNTGITILGIGGFLRAFADGALAGGFFAENYGEQSMAWGSRPLNYGDSALNLGRDNNTFAQFAAAIGEGNRIGYFPMAGWHPEHAGGVALGDHNEVLKAHGLVQGRYGAAKNAYQRVYTSQRGPDNDATLREDNRGAAQCSKIVRWVVTTDDTPVTGLPLPLEEDKAYLLEATVLGKNTEDNAKNIALSRKVMVTRAPTTLAHDSTPGGAFTIKEKVLAGTTKVLCPGPATGGAFTTEVVNSGTRVNYNKDSRIRASQHIGEGHFGDDFVDIQGEGTYEADTVIDIGTITGGPYDFEVGGFGPFPGWGEEVVQATSGATAFVRGVGQRVPYTNKVGFYMVGGFAGSNVAGERVSGSVSGAEGTFYRDTGTHLELIDVTGTFQSGDVLTGLTNEATADATGAPQGFMAVNKRTVATFVSGEAIVGSTSGASATSSSGPSGGAQGFCPSSHDDHLDFADISVGTFGTNEWFEETSFAALASTNEQGIRAITTSGELTPDTATVSSIEPCGKLNIGAITPGDPSNGFRARSIVVGQTSGAWARLHDVPTPAYAEVIIDDVSGGSLEVRNSYGTMVSGETITGEDSGSSATLSAPPTKASPVLTGTPGLVVDEEEGVTTASATFVVPGGGDPHLNVDVTGHATEVMQWVISLEYTEVQG
jgi:hypothetical protein